MTVTCTSVVLVAADGQADSENRVHAAPLRTFGAVSPKQSVAFRSRSARRSSGALPRRRHRGTLSATRAADDDLQTIRRLRDCWPDGQFSTILANLAVAALADHGPQTVALTTRVRPLLGPGWS